MRTSDLGHLHTESESLCGIVHSSNQQSLCGVVQFTHQHVTRDRAFCTANMLGYGCSGFCCAAGTESCVYVVWTRRRTWITHVPINRSCGHSWRSQGLLVTTLSYGMPTCSTWLSAFACHFQWLPHFGSLCSASRHHVVSCISRRRNTQPDMWPTVKLYVPVRSLPCRTGLATRLSNCCAQDLATHLPAPLSAAPPALCRT